MDEDSGLLTLVIFAVGAVIGYLFKGDAERDTFLLDLENWLKSKDYKFKNYFEVHIQRQFSDFEEWRKSKK